LVLKAGCGNSELARWCHEGLTILTSNQPMFHFLLNVYQARTLFSWNVVHAYPLKWNVSDLNAEESKMVVETLELAYNYFKIQ
jgi:phage tail-like protein